MALKIDFITDAINKLRQAFTDGVNASNGLKEGGKINNTFIPDYVLKNESTRILANSPLNSVNAAGFTWYSNTPPTIVSNALNSFMFITPAAGRVYVIKRIKILTSADCLLHFAYVRVTANTIGGSVGTINLDGMNTQLGGSITTNGATVGSFDLIFDKPLILQSGDRLIGYYYKSGTVGVNYTYFIDGDAIANDANYSVKMIMASLGDSLTGITSSDGALQSTLWPEIIKARYRAAGKDIRDCI